MNHPDESIIFGACEPTPVDEELWSLKVVMAKTGLSAPHCTPISRAARFRCSAGWVSGELLGSLQR